MPATHQQTSTLTDLIESYLAVRRRTEAICAPLEIEDYIPQPSVDVSPPKWNIAHTTWFFEEMILKEFSENYLEFNPKFNFLFNSYYNSIGTRTMRDNRGDLSRPTVKEVFQYRKHVDEKMLGLLQGDLPKKLQKIVILGINHEQQHQELLLSDIKYTFSCNPIFPVYYAKEILEEKSEIESNEFAEFAGGIYKIGFEGEGFCFDNERERHRVYLQDFTIAKNLVTNGEYLEFIEDGGYQDFRFWHAEGWDWVNQNEIKAPLYWRKQDGEWFQFTLGGLRKLNLKNPVCHVSFYEAAAFADWKHMRLPTEFEWEAASGEFDWGLRWEWTNSAYLPYPHFKKAKGAVGEYNGKFMINQMVLRGASIATPPNHSRKTYRNFFHPPLRWQFTGIRLAK
ncbi:MAG TPA: ergothioneine biosynthesis protein EgtB [Pyrinomonadaceae bacterium]|nr:ergothioneine biosynthesis protein EgtB [Pyrinomonadaceae bacterium]